MQKKWVFIAGFGIIIIVIIIAGILVSTAHRYDAPESSDVRNISLFITDTPSIDMKDGKKIIHYILETSSYQDAELKLIKIEVIDKQSGKTIYSIGENEVEKLPISTSDNTQVSIPLSYILPVDTTSDTFYHILTFATQGRAILPFSVSGGEITIR